MNQYLESTEFWLVLLLVSTALFLKRVYRERAHKKCFWPASLAEAAARALSHLPLSYTARLLRLLNHAGRRQDSNLSQYAATKLFGCLFAFAAATFYQAWLSVPIALVAFFLPDVELIAAVRQRQKRIKQALPGILDAMVLCADAGLGLDAALKHATAFSSTAGDELRQELEILSRDLLLGMEREKAFRQLFERTGVDQLRCLAAVLIQSANLGISIGQVLRNQSEFTRTQLVQQQEEKAHKIPIYMVFPMWFCIMPSVFLIVLGPTLIKAMKIFQVIRGSALP